MKKFFEFVGVFTFMIVLVLFNAWCYQVIYNNGILQLLTALQIHPPVLDDSFFIMLAAVGVALSSGRGTQESIQLNTLDGWIKIAGKTLSKLFGVGLVVIFNAIMF